MKQKLMLFCLIFALIIPTGITFADDETVSDETVAQVWTDDESYKLLNLLGLMSEENAAQEKPVTRREFVNMLALMPGVDAAKAQYYTDVAASDAANAFVDMGYLKVGDDKLFRPDDYITPSESYAILLRILGYEEYAAAKGGTAAVYNQTAKRVGVSVNTASAEITMRDAAQIILNALNANTYDPVTFTDGGTEYSQGDTLLQRLYDMVCIEGIFSADGTVSVYKNVAAAGEGTIVVGKEVIKCENADVTSGILLGSNVRVYAEKAPGSSVKYASLMVADYDECKITEFTSDDVVKLADRSVTYEIDGKEKTVKLDNPTLIYNGAADFDASAPEITQMMKRKNTEIFLVENSEKSGVSFVAINEYKNAVAARVDTTNNLIYAEDYAGNAVSIPSDANKTTAETVKIYDTRLDGTITPDYIKNGDVISYCISTDGTIVTIYRCSAQVSGAAEALSSNQGISKVTIDGKAYEIADNLLDGKIELGTSATYTLDKFGKIAKVSVSSATWKVGYIYKYSLGNGGLDSDCEFLVYTQDKELKKIKCAKTYTLDGLKSKSGQSLINRITDDAGDIDDDLALIRYKLNSSDEFIEVDTPSLLTETPEAEDTLRLVGERHERKWQNVSGRSHIVIKADTTTVSNKVVANTGENRIYPYPMRKDTAVMMVPATFDAEARVENFAYELVNNGYIRTNDQYYDVTLYSADSDSEFVNYVVEHKGPTWAPVVKSQTYLINKLDLTKPDIDGVARKCIQTMETKINRATPVEFLLDSQIEFTDVKGDVYTMTDEQVIAALTPGDIVMFGGSMTGPVAHVRVIYDYDADDPNTTDDDNRGQVYWGWVDDNGNKLSTYTYRYTNFKNDNSKITNHMGAYGYLEKRIFQVDSLNQSSVHGNMPPQCYVFLGELGKEGSGEIVGSQSYSADYGRLTAFDAKRRDNPAYYSIFTDTVDYESSNTYYDLVILLSETSNELSAGIVFYRR